MLQFFGIVSGLLPLIAGFPYIKDILKKKTKPHRSAFLIWTVLGTIAFLTQAANGATWSLLLTAADTLVTLAIFLFAIKYGTGGYSKRDIGALLLAGIGLIIWYFTKQPMTALLITIGVDAIGAVLTIIKTYEDPQSETFSSWLLASLGGLFAALAVGELSFALLVYPLYIFIANGAVDVVILIRKQKIAK
ncbi:MAG TPA: hypothetical protein VLG47_04340 [Candidatus Saccharimonadales bacterium]|nr:hypothetical protein [Candidatus Saccharimonadales bacterium]